MQPDEDLAIVLTSAIGKLDRAILAGQPDDVSVSEMSVLAHLASRPWLSPAELAVLENMRPPSVTRHIKALTARGLIELTPHPGDKRRVQAGVTPAGRDALEQARKTTWLTTRIAGLDEADRDILAGAVQVLDSLSG
jgi:DNA-binding MarR family transcriptional regulator